MGETRLWYSFFLSVVGIGLYAKCRYQWMLGFSTLMSLVFVFINLLKPEIHSKALMPALQSPWFVPHVIVYMFSYAMLGASTLFAIYLWFRKSPSDVSGREMTVCDNLVRIGWAFLSLGMTMGALWAKEAWGDYWTWDPKETWALATWLSYLVYLHLRPSCKHYDFLFAWLIFSFILLQMCWWGINFLPSAQGSSIHVY
jgi:ABC-type transport system involved in cytochrome c biogenesis permease subunit